MKFISTDKAPGAIGPYSQAVITGNLLFTSGQIAINPATGEVESDTIQGQTEQIMKNLGALWKKPAAATAKRSRPPAFWRI